MPASSFHPASLKNSIPYSQYLRLRCNCSNDILFQEEARKLQLRLLNRGYSKTCLHKAFIKAQQKSRPDLLFKHESGAMTQKENDEPSRMFLRYSNQHTQIIIFFLCKHWSILTDDPTITQFVSPTPSITFKRASSLKDKVVQSEYADTSKRTHFSIKCTFTCGHCSCCPLINKDKRFILPNGDKLFC